MSETHDTQGGVIVPFTPPNLGDVIAYRGVYVLGTTRPNEQGRPVLIASHYASCLVFGQYPLWGVWFSSGKFARFYSFRSEIEAAYPRLIWRRRMAEWSLLVVNDLKPDQRRATLGERYGTKVPKKPRVSEP